MKRATFFYIFLFFFAKHFNPRPREEGDRQLAFPSTVSRDFNPRPREEGDITTGFFSVVLAEISIHALVKRATLRLFLYHLKPLHFNPRPREEGDDCFFSSICSGVNFNPRPREEGDDTLTDQIYSVDISIHALVKRATQKGYT